MFLLFIFFNFNVNAQDCIEEFNELITKYDLNPNKEKINQYILNKIKSESEETASVNVQEIVEDEA